MSVKRPGAYHDNGDEASGSDVKRQRVQHNQQRRQHQNANIDPTWGQKYVFSGSNNATTVPVGEESDFEDDADAMAYLTSVRQEASVIPHLLVAKKQQIGPQVPPGLRKDLRAVEEGEIEERETEQVQGEDGETVEDGEKKFNYSIYHNGVGDTRGWYEDGAYIATAEEPPKMEDYVEGEDMDDEDSVVSPETLHSAYFHAQICQFSYLRATLRRRLAGDVKTTLTTSADPFGPGSRTNMLWSKLVRTTDPHPLQICLMDKDSILRILRVIIGGKFLRRGYVLAERTSCWLWALLARLPDRWELTHVEIGWIRELGKRAVLLSRSLAEMAAMREEIEEGALGVNEGFDASDSDENVLVDGSMDEGDEAASHSDGTDSHHSQLATGDTNTTTITQPDISETHNSWPLQEDESHIRSERGAKERQHGESRATATIESGAEDNHVEAAEHSQLEEAKEGKVEVGRSPQGEAAKSCQESCKVTTEENCETEATGGVNKTKSHETEGAEAGEIEEEGEDVAMEISSPSNAAEDELTRLTPADESLEEAKSRLLAQMDNFADDSELDEATNSTLERSRMNTRATINMILTVAGELYGQRDLLEFREPFVGM